MSTEALSIPRGLATSSARPPALFLLRPKAAERFFDFFTANIRNKNARRAYYKAVGRFSERCEAKGLRDLTSVKRFFREFPFAACGGRDPPTPP